MTVGGSILLIAIGAILRFAVEVDISGIDLQVIGLILMIAGAVGLVLALFYTYVLTDRTAGGPPPDRRYEDQRYYEDRPPPDRRYEDERYYDDRPPPR